MESRNGFVYDGFETLSLTEDLAIDFACMPQFCGERRKQKARVSQLYDHLRAGRFYSPRWATGTLEGKTYRVNGQHSSAMLVDSGDYFPSGMDVIIDRFTCYSAEGLANLFSIFDPKYSARTRNDIINAAGRIHGDLSDVSTTILSLATSGIVFSKCIETGASQKSFSDQYRAGLVHQNKEFILWRNSMGHTKVFRDSGTIAAMYRTYHKDAIAAELFWKLVSDESAPKADCPTRKLARWLLNAKLEADRGVGRRWDAKAYYTKAIHAWNAWRKGVPTQLKYVPKAAYPNVV